MPASAPLSGAMLRSHGDVFLAADRKNRMERVRLDKQIRMFDKDHARHQFSIERQKRTLVHKWQVVSTTTGHSEKALPPEGPQDNVYEKCKHSRNKLSEKRLMEWKVCERQLEKFLRQFQTHSPLTGSKPRPSSSRSARGGRGHPQLDMMAHRSKTLELERQRSVSVVSFAPTTQIITGGVSTWDDDDELTTKNNEGACGHDDDDDDHNIPRNKLHMFRAGLRSASMASFNTYDDPGKLIPPRQPSTPPAKSQSLWPSDDLSFMTEIPEETRIPSPASSPTQVAEILKSSTRSYHDFIRASTFSDTKFFVTKDNVVMTNTLQQTYRELQVNSDGHDSGVQRQTRGRLLGVAPNAASERVSSRSDMSESSLISSEDMEENVFVDEPGRRSQLAISELEELSKCSDGPGSVIEASTEAVPDDLIEQGNNFKIRDSDSPGCIEQPQPAVSHSHAERSGSVSSQRLASESVVTEGSVASPRQIQSVSLPMKKLTIVDDGKEVRVSASAGGNRGDSKHPSFGRRRSTSHLLHLRPATSDGSADARSGLFVGKAADAKDRPSARISLLKKRRQSSAALLRGNVADPTNTATTSASSLASAMTVTSLQVGGGKDGQLQTAKPKTPSHRKQIAEDFSRSNSPQLATTNHTAGSFPFNAAHHSRMPQARGKDRNDSSDDSDTASNAGDQPTISQWRRDLAIEQPEGMRSSVTSLGTVLKAAMVFSRTARRRALSTMVEENNVDTREAIRKERLRKLQCRASVLSKIVSQFRTGNEEE